MDTVFIITATINTSDIFCQLRMRNQIASLAIFIRCLQLCVEDFSIILMFTWMPDT